MQHPRMGRLLLATLGLLLLSSASLGLCQLGLQSYALAHPFGLSTAVTTRQFGMGAPISCVWDRGSGNPAFAATQSEDSASVRWSDTRFEQDMSLTSYLAYVVAPIRANESGLQISYLQLRSSGLALSPYAIDVSEDDLSFHYGRRIGKQWTAGIGLSPWSVIKFNATLPDGTPAMRLTERPDIGARVGIAYEPAPGDYFGIVYDYMLEDVTGSGLAFMALGGSVQQVFHTDLLAIGGSRHITPEWLVAAEWQDATTHAGDIKGGLHGWHLGTEYRWPKGLALRAGLNDGQMTLGAGYQTGQWDVEYAFANNLNNEAVGPILGASDTHQLQALYHW